MNATREGDCAGCSGPIHVGTPVQWSNLGRWHPACVRERYAARAIGRGVKYGRLAGGGGAKGHRP